MDRIAELALPRLDEPFASALHEASALLFERFPSIVGVIAAGTIVAGTPDRESDLDIYVLHSAPVIQRLQRIFCGVPTEMFVNTPVSARRFMRADRERGKCSTAHMIATGAVVFDADRCVAELRAEAAAELASPPVCSDAEDMNERYFAACFQEDARDVVDRDPETASLILSHEVWGILRHAHRRAHRWEPRMKDFLTATAELDAGLSELARRFFRTADVREQLALAERMTAHIDSAPAFFEWESEPKKDGDDKS